MIEQFKSYFAKLERLSCAELDRSAEKLVVAEKGNVAKLIAHIAEISARKTALELGYKNLFDYCARYADIGIMSRAQWTNRGARLRGRVHPAENC